MKQAPPILEGSAVPDASTPSFRQCETAREGVRHENRVLILAPTANDARVTAAFLQKKGIQGEICKDMAELCQKLEQGCGVIFLAEEALVSHSVSLLAKALLHQPSWSSVPIVLVTGTSDPSQHRLRRLHSLGPTGNVTVIERPFHPETLISNLEVALSSRQRQYQVRDLLHESLERERRLSFALQAGNLGAWQLDWELKQLTISGVARKTLELPGEGKHCSLDDVVNRIHPNDRAGVAAAIKQAIRTGSDFHFEYRLGNSPGKKRWIDMRGRIVTDAPAGITRLSGVLQDITKRREMTAELENLVNERTATLQKTIGDLEAFSYTVSHDLRAPIRAIQSYAVIIQKDYQGKLLDEDGAEFLRRIAKAGSRMDELIQDVLAYSKMSRDKVRLHSVKLPSLVQDIIQQYPGFNDRDVNLETDDPDLAVRGSAPLLTQCLSNLLGNAFKFARPGEPPKVAIRIEPAGDRVRLWVEDNGIGIAPEHHNRIFGMFERLDPATYEGTGVGLAIVRKAVERMGGAIGLESTPGQGTKFWIELARA